MTNAEKKPDLKDIYIISRSKDGEIETFVATPTKSGDTPTTIVSSRRFDDIKLIRTDSEVPKLPAD